LFGQATFTVRESLDFTVGARFDHESKEAAITTGFNPPIAGPPVVVSADRSFSNVSPQFAVAYRLAPDRLIYASIARGFKAGGFNPASPTGNETYGEEDSWNLEGGLKAMLAGGRVLANASVFATRWSDLQLDVPNPLVPAQFYVANVGSASSQGVELELRGRPASGIDLFSALGFTHARFGDETFARGVSVADNELPYTPGVTFSIGADVSHAISSEVSIYGRGEVAASSGFQYDEANSAEQDAYSLVNLRVGARGYRLFGEAWVRNAFDTQYVPLAFPYPGLAPSGFVAEPGRPRTFGVTFGFTF
jgi:iron complex outermembrane receptor protein